MTSLEYLIVLRLCHVHKSLTEDELAGVMAVPDFEGWLSDFLEGLNVDGEVYGGYISGTLRTLEGAGPDEAEEALSDILTACIVGGAS